jgi:gluconolactonase
MAAVEIFAPRMEQVIAKDAALEQVATGFIFTEGPIWHPEAQHLTFSDMPGDIMRRWSAADGIETFRQPCNKANGNAYDQAGRMLSCEHASSSVTRTEADGAITTLASHWQGKELNSPNDIVVSRDGSIWFTDPTYGRMEGFGVLRDQELAFQGVYRIAPDGALHLLADDFGQPNGLCFNLDQTRLYVNDTDNGHIRVFDVNADGGISGGSVWAAPAGDGPGAPDGMKMDAAGNIFCTGPGGVHVFAPDATPLGRILTPEVTANFTWGDEDLRSLYFTASTSLYRIRTKTAGVDLFNL